MHITRLHAPRFAFEHAGRRPRAWLVLWGWTVCACLVGPIDSHADIPPADALLQRQWQDIATQLVPLRQTVTPPARISGDQHQALLKQIGTLERQLQQLGDQLTQMQTQRAQQIQHLESHARGLSAALWVLAGLTLALGVVAWHFRQIRLTSTNHSSVPDTSEPAMSASVATELMVQGSTDTQPQPEDIAPAASVVALVPAQALKSVELSSPPQSSVAPPWAALVAADLHYTQQALAQAREGFMQPARIDT